MSGSSSTWYATSARLRSSRSSAARAAGRVVLEDGKQVLRVLDEGVGLFALQYLGAVDPSPADGDGVNAGGLGGADVERRVADVGGIGGRRAETVDRGQDRIGCRLVPLGVVGRDHDVEVRLEGGQTVEGELHCGAALGGDDSEAPSLLAQPRQ